MSMIAISDLNPVQHDHVENDILECASNELDALFGGGIFPSFLYRSGSSYKEINIKGGGLLNPTFRYHRHGNTKHVSFKVSR